MIVISVVTLILILTISAVNKNNNSVTTLNHLLPHLGHLPVKLLVPDAFHIVEATHIIWPVNACHVSLVQFIQHLGCERNIMSLLDPCTVHQLEKRGFIKWLQVDSGYICYAMCVLLTKYVLYDSDDFWFFFFSLYGRGTCMCSTISCVRFFYVCIGFYV